MSWVEISKINSNMFEPLDVLIKRVSAGKMKTVHQTITAARATITTAQTIVNVQGSGTFRRILITGGVKANDATTYPNFYVHPGNLKIDGVQRYAWSGSQAKMYYGGAYINYQGNVTAWVESGSYSGGGTPFYSNTAANGSWPNIFDMNLNWRFTEGFTIDLSAMTAPEMAGNGVSTFFLLYDLEVEA